MMTTTETATTPRPRHARRACAALALFMAGAGCSSYLILWQGEMIGAAVMDFGAQLRNAAAAPDVRMESDEPVLLADYVPPPLPPKPVAKPKPKAAKKDARR